MSADGWYDAVALEAWASSASGNQLRSKIEKTTAFVAALGDRVIGWASLDGTTVDQLYVDPEYGGGVGVARSL